LHALARHDHFLEHDAGRRRGDRLLEARLAGLPELSDLALGKIPEQKALAAGAKERSGRLRRARHLTVRELLLVPHGEQIFLLGADELGAVDREEWLAPANRPTRVIDEQVLDVTAHFERDGHESPLVVVEPPDGTDRLLDRAPLGGAIG